MDVQINENNASLNYGGEATLTTDMDDNGSRVHAMLRFDDIVGTGPGQIPPGSTITSAKLVFNATSSTKGKVIMHRMLKPWGETTTWMDFTPNSGGTPAWTSLSYLNTDTGIYLWQTLPHVMVGGGIQADGVEAMTAADATFTMPKPIPVPFVLQPGGYGTTYQAPAKDPVNRALSLPGGEDLRRRRDLADVVDQRRESQAVQLVDVHPSRVATATASSATLRSCPAVYGSRRSTTLPWRSPRPPWCGAVDRRAAPAAAEPRTAR